MKGLIVKSPWIDKILSGEKLWEIRGSSTSVRGRIALIKSGTGMIFGTVYLVSCSIMPLSKVQLVKSTQYHYIQDLSVIKYNRPFAWELDNPIKFDNPVSYKHPQGAITWVNMPDDILEGKI